MVYKNTRTGAIIDSPCIISGGDWILEGEEINVDNETVDGNVENIETNTDDITTGVDLDSITKKDIMQELDALGKKYNPKDNKATLYALLEAK